VRRSGDPPRIPLALMLRVGHDGDEQPVLVADFPALFGALVEPGVAHGHAVLVFGRAASLPMNPIRARGARSRKLIQATIAPARTLADAVRGTRAHSTRRIRRPTFAQIRAVVALLGRAVGRWLANCGRA